MLYDNKSDTELKSEIFHYERKECVNCGLWATFKCTKEAILKPSISMEGCKDFEQSWFNTEQIRELTIELTMRNI